MAEGGLYDQLGGGFCRYSVDERWAIPHFEKMLYDNGPLLRLYADAWRLTGDTLFKRVAEETAGWVVREMQSPEGGYLLLARRRLRARGGQVLRLVAGKSQSAYHGGGIRGRRGALRPRPAGQLRGRALAPAGRPAASGSRRRTGQAAGKNASACWPRRATKLFAAREERVRPGRDEKILTAGTR
jgi:uncharacterized protein YyaL (SSP411 family)